MMWKKKLLWNIELGSVGKVTEVQILMAIWLINEESWTIIQNSDISKRFQPDSIVSLSEDYSRRDSGIGHFRTGVYEKEGEVDPSLRSIIHDSWS